MLILHLILSPNNSRILLTKFNSSSRHTPIILYNKSAGLLGFKGSSRSSSFAAESLSNDFLNYFKSSKRGDSKLNLSLFISGFSPLRSVLLRRFRSLGVRPLLLKDLTPVPHNGCRLKKSARK